MGVTNIRHDKARLIPVKERRRAVREQWLFGILSGIHEVQHLKEAFVGVDPL